MLPCENIWRTTQEQQSLKGLKKKTTTMQFSTMSVYIGLLRRKCVCVFLSDRMRDRLTNCKVKTTWRWTCVVIPKIICPRVFYFIIFVSYQVKNATMECMCVYSCYVVYAVYRAEASYYFVRKEEKQYWHKDTCMPRSKGIMQGRENETRGYFVGCYYYGGIGAE